jgi:tetratricopeptide (TPR) repeat protein
MRTSVTLSIPTSRPTSRPGRMRAILAALLLACGTYTASAHATEAYTETIDAGDSLAGNYLSAFVAGQARDTSAAAFFYREALRDDPKSADILERAFIALLVEGSYDEATRLAEQIARRDANNGLVQLALSVKDIKENRFAKARGRLERSTKNQAADVTATLLTAWSYAGSKNLKRALQTVDTLKGEDAIATFRDFHAWLIADALGDKQEAAKRFESAYKAENRTLRMVDVYSRFLARTGKTEEAKKVLADFDKLLPRHPVIRDTMDRLEKGQPIESAVPDAAAGAAEVLYGLGSAGNRQGDELAAMLYLRMSLWLAPQNGLVAITLADLYDRLKQPARANDTYDLVSPSSPLRRSAEIQIGINLEQLERKDEAVAHIEKAIAADPKDVESLMALGNVYRSRKDFAKAAEVYTKAIDAIQTPDNGYWALYHYRGIAYERTKEWPKAEADFRKALELSPEQPLVLNYLGYSWVDQNINLDEAFKMLQRAVEQRPTDGYIVDSLGWAHFRLGHYDEAVKLLERAVELKPGDPVINDHLGDAYWRVGRKLEASFQWNHARDMKPEADELPKILDKIANGMPDEPKPAAAEVEKKANGG